MASASLSDPLLVEVIAFAPTAFYQCRECEVAWRATGLGNSTRNEQVSSSLPGDLAQDYQALSDWVRELFSTFGDAVVIKVVDAASLEGFVKSVRHGTHRYPAVIIGGDAKFAGKSGEVFEAARQEISQRLGVRQQAEA